MAVERQAHGSEAISGTGCVVGVGEDVGVGRVAGGGGDGLAVGGGEGDEGDFEAGGVGTVPGVEVVRTPDAFCFPFCFIFPGLIPKCVFVGGGFTSCHEK